jgi:predicted restriction endonuclease
MSIEYINELVNNKYDELYTIENEADKSKNLEKFIYDCLDKYNKNKVMYFIKQLFDIEIQYIEENLYELENSQLKICRNDTEFKKSVHDLYKTCIICDIGDCHKSAYEVAHIWDFSKCDFNESKYDVNNGILLCANMHKYFDSKCGLLKFEVISNSNINNNSNTVICRVVFCESISNSSYYKKYNGKQIKFNKQNIMYLEKKNLN